MAATACPYCLETLASDALAAAGHLVRGIDLVEFDPVRACLAEQHAPLVRDLNSAHLTQLVARIEQALPTSLPAALEQLRTDQADVS
jgi:hypothetical protein